MQPRALHINNCLCLGSIKTKYCNFNNLTWWCWLHKLLTVWYILYGACRAHADSGMLLWDWGTWSPTSAPIWWTNFCCWAILSPFNWLAHGTFCRNEGWALKNIFYTQFIAKYFLKGFQNGPPLNVIPCGLSWTEIVRYIQGVTKVMSFLWKIAKTTFKFIQSTLFWQIHEVLAKKKIKKD